MTDTNPSEGKEEAVPTSEEQQPSKDAEGTQKETPAQEPNEEKQEATPKDGELPSDASERTKEQFAKLQAQLAEERAKNEGGSSVFDSLRPKQPQASQVQPQGQPQGENPFTQKPVAPEPLMDEDGTVDVARVNESHEAARASAEQAQATEQRIIQLDQDRQTREANAAFPQLDPQSKEFDSNFFDMTTGLMTKEYIDGGNRSLIQVAQQVSDALSPEGSTKQAGKEAVKKFKESQDNRQRGPLEEGSGEERQPDSTQEELRQRTRDGDAEAINKRLQNVGVIPKDD